MKKQNLDSKSLSRFLYWSDILYNSELFEKNVDMFDFVILDIDLALIRYRSWSWGTQHMRWVIIIITIFWNISFSFLPHI